MATKRKEPDDGGQPPPENKKMMPPMQASSHVSDAPGWCSDARFAAFVDKISTAVDREDARFASAPPALFASNEGKTQAGGDVSLIDCHIDDPNEDGEPDDDEEEVPWPDAFYVEDAQAYRAKYGSKDGKRLIAMLDDVCDRQGGQDYIQGVLLLGANQPICRTNCIPLLQKDGDGLRGPIVIMRRSK